MSAFMGGGGNFNNESTFQGENGGDANDAELLALLRGVSAKNSSADRFADDDDQENNYEATPALVVEEPAKPPPRNRRDPNATPPWKKGKKKVKPAAAPAAAAPAPAPQPTPASKPAPAPAPMPLMGGGNFKQESTFAGENGGDANDEELLALLRGVSAKNSSADRFADDNGAGHNKMVEQSAPDPSPAPAATPAPQLEPIQKAPAPFMGGGNFKQESNFSGENGGEANDEELLALLRGVSAKNTSADRFTNDNDDYIQEQSAPTPAPAPKLKPKPKLSSSRNRRDPNEVPPWKRGKAKAKAASPPKAEPAPAPAPVPSEPMPFMGGGQFKQESTFDGENGGDANDEELLALLRGVSAKSSSANRFADDGGGQDQSAPAPAPPPAPKPESRNRRDPNEVPPWKRGKNEPKPATQKENAPVPAPEPAPVMGGGNFKQESTFSGENGGDANDEELLALLRGVSAKNSSSNRFADDDGGGFQDEAAPAPVAPPKPATRSAPAPSPPKSQPAPVPAPAPSMGGGNFKQESTFSGERGGDANDEELLALLRGVSSSTGGSRFADEPTPVATPAPAPVAAAPAPKPQPLSGTPFDPNPSPFPNATGEQEEIVVTREDLPTTILSKDWKIKKKSYILLSELIVQAGGSQAPTGAVDANQIFPGLDDMIASTCLMEKNANALESAMEMSISYADYCRGATDAERAEQMATSLVKGSGFTSPRPASARAAEGLALKIMEVGSSADSLNAVIGVLLDQGFASRKPKIVQMSCNLVLKAAQGFGAACLPLAAIFQSIPKLLSHANKKIRDVALEIVAELCRALGSKDPLEEIVSKMKKAQEADLDAMLEKQPQPNPPQIGLRCNRVAGGNQAAEAPGDALAALQANAADLEAERFAKRPEVDLLAELRQVDYAGKLKLAKWNEKVAGLKMILEAGGEFPYKLKQPSSSINYVPLISEMKAILKHTHFAVVSNAMEVLSMLATGVGAKLYPNLRPLLPQLFHLSKDKKLVKATTACLDALFGNVVSFAHILEEEYAIKEALDERKQKNGLARTNAMDFLSRCVARQETAGPRGKLDASNAKESANLACLKLKDTDANVRKAAVSTLKALQSVEDPEIQSAVESVTQELETSNPRVYKQLSGSSGSAASAPAAGRSKASPSSPPVKRASGSSPSKATAAATPPPVAAKKAPSPAPKANAKLAAPVNAEPGSIPTTEEAIARCLSLNIPPFETEDGDCDIISGLQSSKWQLRQGAIQALANFVSNREVLSSPSDIVLDSNCIVVLVKEHTRGFRESNFNLTKAIMGLFLALCGYHEKAGIPFLEWAGEDAATLATEKIADRKLSSFAKDSLSSLCVVRMPPEIHTVCYEAIKKIRAPAAHEELAKWIQHFCNEFGAASLGSSVSGAVSFLVEGCKSKNAKVKKESLSSVGLLHSHLGPAVQPVAYTAAGKDDSLRSLLEKTFEQNAHDPSFANTEWPKCSICIGLNGGGDGSDGDGGFGLDVPKMDLFAELPSDCIDKMRSKESKTSWKARKAAMEDVSDALKRCNGLLDTANMKPLLALCRELCERLSDTQSNLKPVAARLLGTVLSLVEAPAQAKLGRVVYAPLINSAMNENKKMMHDAAMEALQKSTSLHPTEGEGINSQAIIPFVSALAMVLDESEFKASGMSDVLNLTQTFADDLPNLDNVSSQRGETIGGRLAKVVVDGLTSSKADIRAASEALLQACVDKDVFDISTAKRSASRLKPASQRSIGPILARMSASDEPSESQEVEKRSSHSRAPKRGSQTSTSRRSTIPPTKTTRKTNGREYQQDAVSEVPESSHPLIGSSAATGKQKSASAMRLITWPEYPEEPSANTYFTGLKKAWSPLLPPETVKVLFPTGGIRRHDDAKGGCELLKRAIELDKAGEGSAVYDQRGIILKWSVYVLCRKETTAGLQELLSFFSELFLHMMDQNHELTDSESGILLPFIWDRASAAKGRFKDTYMDLLDLCKEESLCPPKKLGPLVCVPVLEASSYPHAKLLACRECYDCVEKIGLSGIGKKGTLALAKALSEEKIVENRNAYLDLMESLLLRMNGDMQRLARICGTSLSSKARDLIEERVKAGGPKPTSTENPRRTQKPKGSPNRSIPSPQKSPNKSPPFTTNKTARAAGVSGGYNSAFGDELPALGLRDSPRAAQSSRLSQGPSSYTQGTRRGSAKLNADSANDILSNLLDAEEMLEGTGGISASNQTTASRPLVPEPSSQSVATTLFSAPPQMSITAPKDKTDLSSTATTDLGAAASLRARLLKIREKNQVPIDTIEVDEQNAPHDKFGLTATFSQDTSALSATSPEKAISPVSGVQLENDSSAEVNRREHLGAFLETLTSLIAKNTPLQEDDGDIFATIDVLKTIHAAVSGQASLAVNLSSSEVAHLRVEIADRANDVVAALTRLIEFGFDCHDRSCSAGMSVPLLSVNLASLMAIFRSDDLATKVVVDDLTLLIREAGKALLDKRLASSSSASEGSKLDDATSTQMVRAINKLAVQAATGAKRDVSFQALIALQQQLSMNAKNSDESMFNSRLTRVVTKLFSRVIKSEESTPLQYDSSRFDTESILCSLEDSLDATLSGDGAEGNRNLAILLVTSMLKARGETFSLRSEMDELGIDSQSSELGKLLTSCATDLGIYPGSPSTGPSSGVATRDVSALVSAVGSAQGEEREEALSALRGYTDTYGDDDLMEHLEQVSDTFREFILEQLSMKEETVDTVTPVTTSESMSARIKSLRSKLNATESAVQPIVETRSAPATQSALPSITPAQDSAPTVRAFRARLAAAQEKRGSATSNDSSVEEAAAQVDSAGGRAAALRARLQKVKRQGMS